MKIGAVLPQTDIGGRVADLRTYAQGVEQLGCTHLLAYDHVVGADPTVHETWAHKYTAATTFHETLVMFGYLAAVTRLELVTGVIVLPQRQTALVAKQASEVDLLCEGRFRLGVAVGWNHLEYDVLGADFTTRGRRLEEQVCLMRQFWTQTSVSFEGRFDTVIGAALAPLPVQRPIPVWIGAQSAAAYRRAGRIGDGWFPHALEPGSTLEPARALVEEAARVAGRDPSALGMEARLAWRGSTPDLVANVERWREVGATHVSLDTMEAGLDGVDAHLQVLEEVMAQLR